MEAMQKTAYQDILLKLGFLASELSSSLKKIKFGKQEFSAVKLVSNLKYYYPSSQINKPFYFFNNQLDYVFANNSAKSETTKGKVGKFLFYLLIPLLTEKLSNLNFDKLIEKLLDILWCIPNNKQINYKLKL